MDQEGKSWHEWRKKGLGSSDAPIIVGVSPYKTPYQLWEEKLDIKNHDSGSDFVKELGHRFEKSARADINLKYELDLKPECIIHEKIPWLRASLDAVDPSSRTLAEIKYVGQKKLDLIRQNKAVLLEHYPQIQHQFLVSGFEKGFYVAYTLDDARKNIADVEILRVEPNIEYIRDKLYPNLQAFWKCITNQTPPALTDKDIKVVKNESLKELGETYLKLKNSYKLLGEAVKELENQLKKGLQEAKVSHPLCQIGKLKIQRVTRKGAVQYKEIPELKDVDLDKYRKPASSYLKFTEIQDEG